MAHKITSDAEFAEVVAKDQLVDKHQFLSFHLYTL